MKGKQTIKLEASKPRNWTVLALVERSGAGRHDKTNKAKRAQEKRDLRRNSDWF